jgi:hypothetical protein
MAFLVDTFKAALDGGGARPNLFEVQVTNPIDGGGDQKLTFTCRAAQLPASTIGTVETFYFGRQVKLAGDRTFAEWTVTILNDEDFVVRNAMERWMNAINGHISNLQLAPEILYKQQATVTQFGKSGQRIKEYTFLGLHPTEVGAIDLAWDTNDTIEEFTVTFQYDYWVSGTTT